MEIQERAQSEQYKSYRVRKRICVSSDWQILERPSSAKPAEAWENHGFLQSPASTLRRFSFLIESKFLSVHCETVSWNHAACDAEFSQKDQMNWINQWVSVGLGEIVGGVVLNWEVSDFHSVIVPGKWLPAHRHWDEFICLLQIITWLNALISSRHFGNPTLTHPHKKSLRWSCLRADTVHNECWTFFFFFLLVEQC